MTKINMTRLFIIWILIIFSNFPQEITLEEAQKLYIEKAQTMNVLSKVIASKYKGV